MTRKKLPKVIRKAGVVELPEDFTGRELKSWIRKKKIPLLKRKMKRTKFDMGKRIREGLAQKAQQEKGEQKIVNQYKRILRGELTFVRSYDKNNPPMRRTKFKTKQPEHDTLIVDIPMKRTKFKK